ncbi:hypothetical protein BJ742DRAFT_738194 [Cladochytrium replicatum]|nr:hypothetical protein BJ742DRAFT_738194 [Cladochytrium replicatum]
MSSAKHILSQIANVWFENEKDYGRIRLLISFFRNLLAISDIEAGVGSSAESVLQSSLQEVLLNLLTKTQVVDILIGLAASIDEPDHHDWNLVIMEIFNFYFCLGGKKVDAAVRLLVHKGKREMVEWVIKELERRLQRERRPGMNLLDVTDHSTALEDPATSLARAVQKDFQLRLLLKQIELEEGEDDRGKWLFPRELSVDTMEELLFTIKESIEMAEARNTKEDPSNFVRKKVQYRKRKSGNNSDDDNFSGEDAQHNGNGGDDVEVAESEPGGTGNFHEEKPVSSKFIGDADDELNDPDFFERELIQREINRRNIETALRSGRDEPEAEKLSSEAATKAKVVKTQLKPKRGRKGREPSESLGEGAKRLRNILEALNSDTDDGHDIESGGMISSDSCEDDADSETDGSVQSGYSFQHIENKWRHGICYKSSSGNFELNIKRKY